MFERHCFPIKYFDESGFFFFEKRFVNVRLDRANPRRTRAPVCRKRLTRYEHTVARGHAKFLRDERLFGLVGPKVNLYYAPSPHRRDFYDAPPHDGME